MSENKGKCRVLILIPAYNEEENIGNDSGETDGTEKGNDNGDIRI